jgi:uncharacterized protein (DUF1330 family)
LLLLAAAEGGAVLACAGHHNSRPDMTVYILAQLKFTNVEAYRRYQARFGAVFRQFDGKLLAADEGPKVVEGDWDGDKVVLMSFPDEASCQRFMNAPDYQEISKDRKAGADTIVLQFKGLSAKSES